MWQAGSSQRHVRLSLSSDLCFLEVQAAAAEPMRIPLAQLVAIHVVPEQAALTLCIEQLGSEGLPLREELCFCAPDALMAADWTAGLALAHDLLRG